MPPESSNASLELLYNTSRELATSIDLHEVLPRVLFLCVQNVGAERGSLIVMDDNQKPIDAAIVYKNQLIPHSIRQLQSTLDQGLAGWVVRNRLGVCLSDTSKDDRWLRRPDDSSERTGAKSAICVPILGRDQLVGVLTAVHPKPGVLDQNALYLLQSIADQAGFAIYNARLYEALQSTHRRYRELFEENINPIMITNKKGRILEANKRAQTMFGYSITALADLNIYNLHEVDREQTGKDSSLLKPGVTVSYESAFLTQEGQLLPVQVFARAVQVNGEMVYQWVFEDIRERKELDGLRENLVAMIYHDLRSPLSNIISSLDMFHTVIPADCMASIQPILSITNRSTERMQRLINSLLDIYRLEAGQPLSQTRALELPKLFHEAVDAIQPIMDHRLQSLNLDLAEQYPQVIGDEDMIRRVIINLLENATKFTPNKGVITLSARVTGSHLQVTVQDNGSGIPAAMLDEIFKKFSRVQSKNMPKGLGLGLAFCQLAVKAHNGRIWVESELDHGSRFIFTLPVVE
jgi:PAS domain S-box-containing protein